jgi:hypothetical protein
MISTYVYQEDDIKINLLLQYKDKNVYIRVKQTMLFDRLPQAVSHLLGIPDLNIWYDGHRYFRKTLREIGMEDGDTIDAIDEQVGGKPVIYVFSPEDIDTTVTLSLIPEWQFSVIYPVVPIKYKDNGREIIQWDVQTHVDGSLTEKTTGLDVSYLFWEAQ